MELKIEYLPVSALRPYGRNARKHGTEDVAAIAASIREFGFDDPIGVWSEKNIIVEGHGRLEAAKLLKLPAVPVIRLDHLTDEQRRAYALAHNRTAELSAWDIELQEIELEEIYGIDMSEFGFEVPEEPTGETAEPRKETSFNYSEQYGVIVMCDDEAHQEEVYNRLTEEGYNCRVVAV